MLTVTGFGEAVNEVTVGPVAVLPQLPVAPPTSMVTTELVAPSTGFFESSAVAWAQNTPAWAYECDTEVAVVW